MFYSGKKIIIYYERNKEKDEMGKISHISIMHTLLMEISDLKNLMEEKEIYQIGLQLILQK